MEGIIYPEDVVAHVRRCPLAKQIEGLKLKPYYQQGINAGSDEEDSPKFRNFLKIHGLKHTSPRADDGFWVGDIKENATFEGDKTTGKDVNVEQVLQKNSTNSSYAEDDASSDIKRKAIFELSGHEFHALVEKIQSAHSAFCQNKIQDSFLQPSACDKWLKSKLDRRLPFQEKHVIQQASMLGNLEMLGILRRIEFVAEPVKNIVTAKESEPRVEREGMESELKVVEFGAGRGYLTHMLSDCYGIKRIVLVERRSYKFKADRTLRQTEAVILERLRIDIEDLNLEAVEPLKDLHYVAVGKHVCGPATDLALRCCLRGQNCNKNTSEDIHVGGSHPCLKGLAIATCCHHLCQWKPYVNKSFFINLGFTKEEFHAVTWFTSWALDGEHCSDSSGVNHSYSPDLQIWFKWPNIEKPLVFLECVSTEETTSEGNSFFNWGEALQVGKDAHGTLLRDALSSCGVHLDYLNTVSVPTGHAVVMLQPGGENSIIIVGGANISWPSLEDGMSLSINAQQVICQAGIVLLQREVPDSLNVEVAKIARSANVPVILDAGGMEGPIPEDLLKSIDIFSPNETELARLTGTSTDNVDQVIEAARKCHKMGVKKVLVKLGAQGSVLVAEDFPPIIQPAIPAPIVLDTTGAGDTFTAAFAVALVEGKSPADSLKFAAAAASLCIQVKGAIPSMPDRQAVLQLLQDMYPSAE